jgi:GTPase
VRFVDEVTLHVKAGDGGDGSRSFRREKFEPRGGPDGGDGGDGGAVIFIADAGLNTLIDFSFHPHLAARDGGGGSGNQCNGASARDLVVRVPVGCQVFFGEQLVADLSSAGARWVAARGGRGGKGNAFFKSATLQAPDFSQTGQPGESFLFRLVLKSVADVGLVGLPNVGKSTLISKISRAHPKVADYPFTTTEPHLGVVLVGESARFVVADIPGLIPGAHLGKGLGTSFLKHIERTSAIAQLIDASLFERTEEAERFALEQFEIIDHELRSFSPALGELPRVIVFTKGDLPQVSEAYQLSAHALRARGFSTHLISSLSGLGLGGLIEELLAITTRSASRIAEESQEVVT